MVVSVRKRNRGGQGSKDWPWLLSLRLWSGKVSLGGPWCTRWSLKSGGYDHIESTYSLKKEVQGPKPAVLQHSKAKKWRIQQILRGVGHWGRRHMRQWCHKPRKESISIKRVRPRSLNAITIHLEEVWEVPISFGNEHVLGDFDSGLSRRGKKAWLKGM